MHLPEGDANDGDAENDAVEGMGEPNPNAANKEPKHIHEYAQATWLRGLPLHLRAERPDGQHTQLHALQTKRYSDDGNHQNQTSYEILQGNVQPAEDNPDDVS